MLRLGLFRALAVLAYIPFAVLAQGLTREGGRWVETITGTTPAAARLRVLDEGLAEPPDGGAVGDADAVAMAQPRPSKLTSRMTPWSTWMYTVSRSPQSGL